MKNEALLYKIRLSLIIGLAIFMQLLNFSLKEIYHIDELFSYGLANGENGVYLFKDASEIDNKLLKGEFFENYLTRSPNSSYKKMWDNLKYDNHMPLYFVLLHTISNFFPPVFTPYPGIILNVITLLLLLIIFYKLSNLIFKDKEIALASTSLFAFSESILFLAIFIRMYLVQTLCATTLLYYTIKLISNNKEANIKTLCIISILSTLTILSHYYSIIFCFILTLSSSLVLLKNKQYKIILQYGLCMLISIIIAYIIYPEMLIVGTKGERGGQVVSLITQFIENPSHIFSTQISLFINTFFANNCIALIALFISLVLLILSKKVLSDNQKDILTHSFMIFLGYSVTSTLIMPNMTTYQIRYYSPVIPLGIILIIYFSIVLFRLIKAKTILLHIFLWLIVALNGYYIITYPKSAFYLRGNEKYKRTEQITQGAEIWWGLGGSNKHSWIIHNYIDKLATAEKVWTLVEYDNKEFLTLAKAGKENKKYAYLFMPKTQENMPQGAEEWIKNTTNRQGYYMYTLKTDKSSAMAFEASIYLVCPY